MGKQWKQWPTLFYWAPKITADGDCNREIKRHLLLGRKAMTNLDSILKCGDITFTTKACLVKAMFLFLFFFPVTMYRCESWTIKKTECQRSNILNCGAGENSWVPWTAKRSNQLILNKINTEYPLEGLILKLKLQYFDHLMQRAGSLEKTLSLGKIEGRRRKGRQRLRLLYGITDSMDTNLSKLQKTVRDREAWYVAVYIHKSWNRYKVYFRDIADNQWDST